MTKLEELATRIQVGAELKKKRNKLKKRGLINAKKREARVIESKSREKRYVEQDRAIFRQDINIRDRRKRLEAQQIRLLTLLQNRPEVFTPFVKPEKVRKPKPKKEPVVRPAGPAYRPITQREVAYAVALTKKKNQFLFVFSMSGEQFFECVASRPSYALDVFHIEMPHLAHLAKLDYGTREIVTTKPLSVFQNVRFNREWARNHARRAHREILFTFELKNGPGRTPTSVVNKKYFQCIAYDSGKADDVLRTELTPRPLEWNIIRQEDVTDKFIIRTLKPTAEGNWL